MVQQIFIRSRRRRTLEGLTPREREVLSLMAQGRSNQAIADALFVSAGSVEKHISSAAHQARPSPRGRGEPTRDGRAALPGIRGPFMITLQSHPTSAGPAAPRLDPARARRWTPLRRRSDHHLRRSPSDWCGAAIMLLGVLRLALLGSPRSELAHHPQLHLDSRDHRPRDPLRVRLPDLGERAPSVRTPGPSTRSPWPSSRRARTTLPAADGATAQVTLDRTEAGDGARARAPARRAAPSIPWANGTRTTFSCVPNGSRPVARSHAHRGRCRRHGVVHLPRGGSEVGDVRLAPWPPRAAAP